jgi:hypothetical protein
MSEHFDYRELRDRSFSEQRMRERAELEGRDADWARARRQRQREEQRAQQSEVDKLRSELQQEVANLRNELSAQHECQIAATGQALGEMLEKVVAHGEEMVRKVERELFALVERRFGKLMGRLDGILPESSRAKDFKFASERDNDGPLELPNPLSPRRRVLDS